VTKIIYSLLLASVTCSCCFAQTAGDSTNSVARHDTTRSDSQEISAHGSQLSKMVPAIKDSEELPREATLTMRILNLNPFFDFLGQPKKQFMIAHIEPTKDELFYTMLGLLLYFGLIKVAFDKYVSNLFLLFFRASMRKQQIREQLLQTPLPSLLLNTFFVASAGLYGAFLANHYGLAAHQEFPLTFGICATAIASLYLVKFAILKMSGWIFNISMATDAYIFVVFLVNKMMGILLIPFLVVLAFTSAEELYAATVTISLIMIGILLVYRFSTGFRHLRNEIKLSIFHFFIYLCAFEITPVVLIYKVLLAYLEKAS